MPGKLPVSAALIFALAFFLGLPIANAQSPGTLPLGPGQTRQIASLRPLIDTLEGIAIDDRGHIFVSNGRLQNDIRVVEILDIAPDGTVSVFATLDLAGLDGNGAGPAGLAFDSKGELYAAVPSDSRKRHGVWHVQRDGTFEKLAGSQHMLIPNALAFDADDNLYVTDSMDGTVWRFPPGGGGQLWIRDVLLAPDPAIGANGIAFVPPDKLYVANLDRALIARIRIQPDGKPAAPELAATGFELWGIDGLAADANGMLYGCIVVSKALGTWPLVAVDPKTGRITPSTADPSAFDLPTSLAVGRGPLDRKSVYVVNSGGFAEERPEAAPGVVQVGVGVRGAARDAMHSTIADSPGEFQFLFALDPLRVTEEDMTLNVSVQRVSGSQGAVSVEYATLSGGALAGTDYVAKSGTLNWADGDSSTKSFGVRILEDSVAESDERFSIHLSNPTGGAKIAQFGGFRSVVILNDDLSGGGGGAGGGGGGGGGGDSGGGGGALDYLALLFLAGLTLMHRPRTAHSM